MRRPAVLAALVVIISLSSFGCSGDEIITPPPSGSLDVVTGTSGPDPDADGYLVQLDEGGPTPIGSAARLSLSGLAAGDHIVRLAGVAANCSAAEGLSQTVTVSERTEAVAHFTVTCVAVGGALEITSETGGVDLDQDGYTVQVDGREPQPIAPNGSLRVAGLEKGTHSVRVEGVADNCGLDGENPRVISFGSGEAATLRLPIRCEVIRRSRIAFVSSRLGEWDVLTVRPDGSAPVNLTADLPGPSMWPSWSPDGGRIAFSNGRDGNLYVMNADGGGRVNLTPGDRGYSSPVWSPDGRRILTHSGGDLVLVNADGSGQRFLTFGNCAAWSPGGERIAFASGGRLFTIQPDGTGLIGLTAPAAYESDCVPKWSPDGTRIAFERNGPPELEEGWHVSNLWIVNADGSHPVKLTNFLFGGSIGATDGHAWSAEGTRLVLSGLARPGLDFLGWDILMLDPSGGEPANLTHDHAGREFSPVWSPDGRQILYELESVNPETSYVGAPEVVVMDLDGGNRRNLSNHPSTDYGATWQP